MSSRLLSRVSVGVVGLALAACGGASGEGDGESVAAQKVETTKLCAAVRGNGESILTHFASLARIVEHFGVLSGIAGGSSGSITTFTYESVLMHPAVGRCGEAPCSEDEKAARVALALKSLQGYADVVAGSPEAASVKGLAEIAADLQKAYAEQGIAALAPSQVEEAASRLRAVLSVPELAALVNPEVFVMLSDQENLAFNVAELETSITQLGAFSVEDNRLFFRSGVLDWSGIATLLGRVGDFYAGYGPSDHEAMSAWLDACAAPTRGKPWAEAASVALPEGGTCGEAFAKLLGDYRAKVRDGSAHVSRIDERIGAGARDLTKLVTTAVLEGEAASTYESTLAAYHTGVFPAGQVPFSPSFDDVRFGYWGSASDLARLVTNTARADDLKSKKATALGDATWREILSASPAEPGLSRFVKLSDGRWSAGGWSDLAPTLALEAVGCEQTVYVTREGDESPFAVAIAKHLGMSERAWRDLYDLGNASSSYSRSVAAAEGVWCTRWNDFDLSTMDQALLDAYGAPLEARVAFVRRGALQPYDGMTPSVNKAGCTPGVSAGATYPR